MCALVGRSFYGQMWPGLLLLMMYMLTDTLSPCSWLIFHSHHELYNVVDWLLCRAANTRYFGQFTELPMYNTSFIAI